MKNSNIRYFMAGLAFLVAGMLTSNGNLVVQGGGMLLEGADPASAEIQSEK